MSLFLSPAEVVELTGKRIPAAQARALNKMGVTHKRRADGAVLVHRLSCDEMFGIKPCSTIPPKRKEINWSN